jgi:hypothetical protein
LMKHLSWFLEALVVHDKGVFLLPYNLQVWRTVVWHNSRFILLCRKLHLLRPKLNIVFHWSKLLLCDAAFLLV